MAGRAVLLAVPAPESNWSIMAHIANPLSAADRRATPRFPSGLQSSCLPITAVSETMWTARVRDISTNGIGLCLSQGLEPGIMLVVMLPGPTRDAPPRTLQARVVRVVRQSSEVWLLGCALAQGLSEDEVRVYQAQPRSLLIVDDDVALCKLLQRGLRPHGFTIWVATSGKEALELYQQHGDVIRMVLMDVNMPGLDGPTTLEHLQAINPEVRCLFMSGDTGQYTEEDLLNRGSAGLLRKPFRLLEAAQLIWQLAEPEQTEVPEKASSRASGVLGCPAGS